MRTILAALFVVLLFPVFSPAQPAPRASVEEVVQARTGMEVVWQKNETDREMTRQLIRKLLAQPITVSSAMQIALLNNRNLQAIFEDIGIAESAAREAVTIPNPSIDFDVQFPLTPNTVNRYGWLIGQEFVQILMMPLRKRLSEQALEAAQLHVAAEVLHLIAEVKKAYFIVQADQQLLAYTKTIQEIRAASLEFAQQQYQAGNITNLALLKAQSTYNEGRLDMANMESLCQQHREDFNILLGLWGKETGWKIRGNVPLPGTNHFSSKYLESLAVSQRLDLQSTRYRIASLTSALGLTKTFRWIPVLDFGLSGERDNDKTLNIGPQFRVEVPIFNQGQFRIERAQSEIRRAVTKFESLAIEIRSNVRKLNSQLQVQAAKANFYRREVLPTQQRIISNSMDQYHAMQISPLDLFLTKAEELKMEKEYIETLRDYWITWAELERTVGGTLTPHKINLVLPRVAWTYSKIP